MLRIRGGENSASVNDDVIVLELCHWLLASSAAVLSVVSVICISFPYNAFHSTSRLNFFLLEISKINFNIHVSFIYFNVIQLISISVHVHWYNRTPSLPTDLERNLSCSVSLSPFRYKHLKMSCVVLRFHNRKERFKDRMGGECGTRGRGEKCLQCFGWKI